MIPSLLSSATHGGQSNRSQAAQTVKKRCDGRALPDPRDTPRLIERRYAYFADTDPGVDIWHISFGRGTSFQQFRGQAMTYGLESWSPVWKRVAGLVLE